MTVRVSAAVMAHPKRGEMVADLLARLDRPVPVVWDQVGDRHDTGIRAIEAYDQAATHHLVIQDDALPCRDLLASIEQALVHVPSGHPASFYVGRVRPFSDAINKVVAAAEGQAVSWLRFTGPLWGPAIVVPTGAIPYLSNWWATPKAERIKNYDRRVATWFDICGFDCFYSWPSLVDHRGDDSLVSGHNAIRTAHNAVPADRSGLEVDWSGAVLTLERAVAMDRERQRAALRAGVRPKARQGV